MLGMQELNADEMTRKLEDMLPVIRQVNEQFRDPVSRFSMTESIVLHRNVGDTHQLVLLSRKDIFGKEVTVADFAVSIVMKFTARPLFLAQLQIFSCIFMEFLLSAMRKFVANTGCQLELWKYFICTWKQIQHNFVISNHA